MRKFIIAALAILIGVLALTACGSSDKTVSEKSINGTYKSDGETRFTVMITDDQMQVVIGDGTDVGLYWQGSVPANAHGKFTSTADKAALDASILGSGLDKKEFIADGDSVKFEFQAMGMTKQVKTTRSKGNR